MTDDWEQWKPISGLLVHYDISSLVDKGGGLFISLVEAKRIGEEFNANSHVQILFNRTFAYRNTYETYRYKLILELSEKYGTTFYADWKLFKVHNSSYVKWISDESCTISDDMELMHFAFITDDVILEVLATCEPTFSFLVQN